MQITTNTNPETTHHHQVLMDLVGMAQEIAIHTQKQILAQPADHPTTQSLNTSFNNTSRNIRDTVLLVRKLAEPLRAPRAPRAQKPPQDRTTARKRIIRAIDDKIHNSTGHKGAERLYPDLLDRLDAPDLEYDLTHRPIEEIILEIARDLGLEPAPADAIRNWKRRSPADLKALHAQAEAEPGKTPAFIIPPPPAPKPPQDPKDIVIGPYNSPYAKLSDKELDRLIALEEDD